MRISVLEECVKSCELECKSSRETALRLTGELERERRKVASSAVALDSVKLVTSTNTHKKTIKYHVYQDSFGTHLSSM